MANFTPKPWTLDESISPELLTDDYHQVEAGRGFYPHGFCVTGFMSKEDARLISLAPDLYEALYDLLELHEDEPERPAVSYALRVLAKVQVQGQVSND